MAPKKQKTPQEKKQLSYKKDCRNMYGENDKSSRTAIRKRKKWVNQTYRRTVNQELNSAVGTEDVDGKVKEVKRKQWKKTPDRPLGEVLKQRKLKKTNKKRK